MSEIKLIVGLGNPGDKYADTRHNAGEWLINRLARQFHFSLTPESKFSGKTARTVINGNEIRFLVPTTFMNLSGKAISSLANFYRIKPEEILVIHDELDLPPGVAKIKQGGGHGGHNGLRDTIAQLGNNKNFYRLRVGIGHPGDKNLVSAYVLNKPSLTDWQLIDKALDEATSCVDILIKDGITKATNRLNAFKA
ncbi:aminoacyl-tRNA hydrolase [Pasteurella multocida]|uniref:Peptidyl-tRNA hydrolase n=1 Tax=Pasteurella multocida (strain Pm70) TaxID=272843 RepID=PTH_PASMU|nr:aminoacyl-tRNA hydrolase [Pasteurella multocida]P57820.1 RecName: Full=Peptidyl-tRNA hydrolase; Short=PTH [Pasteurella multocida subsp. multocida str. Pm70]AAK02248.1 Pth [Pasteurella multocida subsp. multocida str. Pm70]APW55660.1 peptidyl-tRNA hydrolase [Pasteurella multocida subsp. multocida str. HN07]ARA70518.1 peptidyl-tRNA hydrolase [Pasteurella multocida subsp. multocida]AUL52876.1 peptidyl-tRNA hydrolase [Pasteurella multocida]EPE74327.1 peptidyl-tRNA hydrolase [Pasteurella multoci